MTREIKFRGKRLDNGEWIYGNLIIAENGAPYIFPPDICEVDGHHLRQGDDAPHWVDPATVGQYTGLKDRNGTEIYEDDIVAFGDRDFLTAAVKFGQFDEHDWTTTKNSGSYGWYLAAIQCQGEAHHVKRPFSQHDGHLLYWPPYVAERQEHISNLIVEVLGNIHDNPELLDK